MSLVALQMKAQTPTFRTADDLLQQCQDKTPDELIDPSNALMHGFCLGLFNGLIASSVAATLLKEQFNLGRPLFCAPSGVTPDQARRSFLKWMNEHPENLHEDAIPHAVISLMKAFPCDGAAK
jgi:hypothetical protein